MKESIDGNRKAIIEEIKPTQYGVHQDAPYVGHIFTISSSVSKIALITESVIERKAYVCG